MGKTSEKVTKNPKRAEAAGTGREKYMNKLKESILNDVKKVIEILPMQAMKLPAQDQMILMSMALVCL